MTGHLWSVGISDKNRSNEKYAINMKNKESSDSNNSFPNLQQGILPETYVPTELVRSVRWARVIFLVQIEKTVIIVFIIRICWKLSKEKRDLTQEFIFSYAAEKIPCSFIRKYLLHGKEELSILNNWKEFRKPTITQSIRWVNDKYLLPLLIVTFFWQPFGEK